MTTGTWSSATNPTDYASKSFAGMLTRLYPNGAYPLFLLSSMLQTAKALQFDHGYWSKTMEFPTLVTNATAYSAAETAWADIVSNNKIVVGQIYRVAATGEHVLVRSIVSATSITVLRAFGTIATGAVPAGTTLHLVGVAMPESSTRPIARYILPIRVTNYTQIFRNTWLLSGTSASTQTEVGNGIVAENRADCAMFHATDIETGIFFGQKFSGTDPGGQPIHSMDGILNVIATHASGNQTTAGGTTTYDQLETALDPCFNQNTDPQAPNERILFVGGTARKVINKIGRLSGTYQIMDGATSFGLQFSTFKISRGTFRMIEHPIFNSNTTWSKMAVAVDLSTFKLAYMNGRNTSNQEFNLAGTPVDSGIDAVGGTLTSELTTEIRNPSANGVIYGLTAAA